MATLAGQAQREFTGNEALLRADWAIQCVVEGELQAPPALYVSGQAWLVGTAPTGVFCRTSAAIAGWTPSGWRFVEAVVGLRVLDKSAGCFRLFSGTWQTR